MFSKANLQILQKVQGFLKRLCRETCSQHMQNPCEQAPGTPSRGGGGEWGWPCPPAAEDEDMEREGSKPQERAFVRSMEQSKPLQKKTPTNQTKKNPKKSCFVIELRKVRYKNMSIALSLSLVGRSQVAVFSPKIRFVAFSVLKVSP